MRWVTLAFFSAFLLAAVSLLSFAVYLAVRARREGDVGLGLASALLFAGGTWTLSYAFQASTRDLQLSLRLVQVEFLGLLAMAPIWLAYVLWYTHRREAATTALRVGGAVSGLLWFVVLTNDAHGLIYRAYEVRGPPIHSLEIVYGGAFPLVLIYLYLVLVATSVVLAGAAFDTRGTVRRRIVALLAASLVPGVAGIVHLLGFSPVPGLNVVALSMVVTVAVGVVSVERFGWLELHATACSHVLDQLAESIVVVDEAGHVLDHNRAATSLGDLQFGVPVEGFAPELADVVSRAREQGERLQVETTLSDGATYLTTVEPIGNGCWAVLLNDVTERARAENRLRQRHETIEGLHAVAREITAATDYETACEVAASGALTAIDADACQLLAPEDSETEFAVLGNAGDAPRSPAVDPAPVLGARRSGRPLVVGDLSHRSAVATESTGPAVPAYRSGLFVPVEGVGVAVALSHDANAFDEYDQHLLELLASHLESVADRLDAEARLREERDRLEEFAGVVSHDLRSPLNVAMGFVQLAREERDFDQLDRVENALSRMNRLIDDLLALSREGEIIGETEPVSLSAAIEDAWASVQRSDAELIVAGDLGTVEADYDRLVELLVNLFQNSVEHGSTGARTASGGAEHAGPAVTVEVGPLDDGFYVADDGPGIPGDEQELVFERGHTTSKRGTGFGLAIVREIAEAHGWEITATEATGERVVGGVQFEIRDVEPV